MAPPVACRRARQFDAWLPSFAVLPSIATGMTFMPESR
jgi:hypothetical protein